jgi:hypothetical protein
MSSCIYHYTGILINCMKIRMSRRPVQVTVSGCLLRSSYISQTGLKNASIRLGKGGPKKRHAHKAHTGSYAIIKLTTMDLYALV